MLPSPLLSPTGSHEGKKRGATDGLASQRAGLTERRDGGGGLDGKVAVQLGLGNGGGHDEGPGAGRARGAGERLVFVVGREKQRGAGRSPSSGSLSRAPGGREAHRLPNFKTAAGPSLSSRQRPPAAHHSCRPESPQLHPVESLPAMVSPSRAAAVVEQAS